MTATPPVSTATAVAVDTAAATLAAVEHLVQAVDQALTGVLPVKHVISTHVSRTPTPRFVVVLGWEGSGRGAVVDRLLAALPQLTEVSLAAGTALVVAPELAEGAEPAVAEHRSRSAGRLARYPGRTEIERRLTAAEVVARSCVDVVDSLAGTVVGPESVLDLTGFARPTWREGRCSLLVQPAAGGVLVPFEARDQVPCCADH
ncbi:MULTISPECIES: hypothetical protein [Nocardioides]|uniref:Uncharacterized protein n=1 Tax=Nocardioides vastitatis TaxID=2568655 RepID=A0ABW0ZCJ8_9ACTN|nr:hypothetical protein [Nocardioides sp.]THI94018.1 hypothetical protein E7Z54_20540 [Nocardioides sp.]